MTFNDEPLRQISSKLDVLIRLTALNIVKDTKTQKDQISLLSEAGFQPKQIADIIGSNNNVVSVTLNVLKKKKTEQETKQELKVYNSPENKTTSEESLVGGENDKT